jgi:NAD/NADP transhydrogenase beta subunit
MDVAWSNMVIVLKKSISTSYATIANDNFLTNNALKITRKPYASDTTNAQLVSEFT